MRCLAKNPKDRPSNGQLLAEELEALDLRHWSDRDARAWWKDYVARRTKPGETIAPELFSIDVGRRLE
jgi:hypothetical protein